MRGILHMVLGMSLLASRVAAGADGSPDVRSCTSDEMCKPAEVCQELDSGDLHCVPAYALEYEHKDGRKSIVAGYALVGTALVSGVLLGALSPMTMGMTMYGIAAPATMAVVGVPLLVVGHRNRSMYRWMHEGALPWQMEHGSAGLLISGYGVLGLSLFLTVAGAAMSATHSASSSVGTAGILMAIIAPTIGVHVAFPLILAGHIWRHRWKVLNELYGEKPSPLRHGGVDLLVPGYLFLGVSVAFAAISAVATFNDWDAWLYASWAVSPTAFAIGVPLIIAGHVYRSRWKKAQRATALVAPVAFPVPGGAVLGIGGQF
jgi:hypothetical protein